MDSTSGLLDYRAVEASMNFTLSLRPANNDPAVCFNNALSAMLKFQFALPAI
jgi:hypothetical protein